MNQCFISAPPLLRRPPAISNRTVVTACQKPPDSNDERTADFDSIVNWVLKGPAPSANTSSTNSSSRNPQTPSSNSNPSRNQYNRRNSSRQHHSSSSSVGDIFQFPDESAPDSQVRPVQRSNGFRDPAGQSGRSRTKKGNRGSRARSDPKSPSVRKSKPTAKNTRDDDGDADVDIEQDLDLTDDASIVNEERDGSEVELSQVDDTVDEGFFSRYKKETGSGKRVVNYTYLDAEDANSDDFQGTGISPNSARKIPGGSRKQPQRKKMDREKAASAFDAMDRLFGSLNPGNESNESENESTPRAGQQDQINRSKQDARQRRDISMNRAAWLADVRARAATKGNHSQRDGADKFDDFPTLDVDAVESPNDGATGNFGSKLEPSSAEEAASTPIQQKSQGKDDEFAEAALMGGQTDTFESVQRTSGYKAQENSDAGETTPSQPSGTTLKPDEDDTENASSTLFKNLMNFARQGPDHSAEAPHKTSTHAQSRKSRSASPNGEDNMFKFAQSKSRGQQRQPSEGTSRHDVDASAILGLTKRIASTDTQLSEDGENIETVVEWGDSSSDRAPGRNRHTQKYTAVRRIGGRTRRILSEPDVWKPMDESSISRVRSDNRPLGGTRRGSHLNSVVAECQTCRGSGLVTCDVCRGTGWILPLSKIDKQDSILQEIWKQPNLVVDSEGEAQCVKCNGIGKQFCGTCDGSGLTSKRGFSLSDRNEAFDIFPGVDKESFPDETDEFFDDDDDDDDGVEEEDDTEYFQLYQGPENTFSTKDKEARLGGKSSVDADDEEEAIEVEDESAELLAALEAMHLAESGENDFDQDNDESIIIADEDDADEDDVDEDDDFGLESLEEIDSESSDISDEDDDDIELCDNDDQVEVDDDDDELYAEEMKLGNEDDIDDDLADVAVDELDDDTEDEEDDEDSELDDLFDQSLGLKSWKY